MLKDLEVFGTSEADPIRLYSSVSDLSASWLSSFKSLGCGGTTTAFAGSCEKLPGLLVGKLSDA